MDTCPQDSHMFVIFQEHFQKQRIENSMGSSEPTPKQVSYLCQCSHILTYFD